jgi:hypothetical protein
MGILPYLFKGSIGSAGRKAKETYERMTNLPQTPEARANLNSALSAAARAQRTAAGETGQALSQRGMDQSSFAGRASGSLAERYAEGLMRGYTANLALQEQTKLQGAQGLERIAEFKARQDDAVAKQWGDALGAAASGGAFPYLFNKPRVADTGVGPSIGTIRDVTKSVPAGSATPPLVNTNTFRNVPPPTTSVTGMIDPSGNPIATSDVVAAMGMGSQAAGGAVGAQAGLTRNGGPVVESADWMGVPVSLDGKPWVNVTVPPQLEPYSKWMSRVLTRMQMNGVSPRAEDPLTYIRRTKDANNDLFMAMPDYEAEGYPPETWAWILDRLTSAGR